MSALPNMKGALKLTGAFNAWHGTTEDDSDMMEMFCPQIVSWLWLVGQAGDEPTGLSAVGSHNGRLESHPDTA
jgi:hypothetical protein